MLRFRLGGSSGPGALPGRIARIVAAILTIYALALLSFFFLTPVRQSVLAVFRPVPVVKAQPGIRPGSLPARPTATPTPNATAEANPTPSDNVVVSVQATVAPGETPAPVPVSLSSNPRFAFLLLGYGGGGHDGAYLTDSMMLVIVDSEHKTLTLLSIPRDSWVPLLFDGQDPIYNKINTAYAFAIDSSLYPNRLHKYTGANGAGVFTSDTVARLIGIPIAYYLSLDFTGFRQMIDAVGGIDVNVPDDFTARYPANDDPEIDASWMAVEFKKGPEHMNGERALEFARAREAIDNASEGNDFARSRRQRIIIEAFKNRVLQPAGLIQIPRLVQIAGQHVDTNYAIPAAARISQLVLDWKDVRIYQTALTTADYLEEATGPEGTYAEVPSSPSHSWLQIQGFTKALWDDPAAGVAMARTSIELINRSDDPDLGDRVSNYLIAHGYLIDTIQNGSPTAQSQVIAQSDSLNRALAQHLAQDLKLPNLPISAAPAPSDRFTLVLGHDAAKLTLPDLRDTAPRSTVGILAYGSWDPDLTGPSTGEVLTVPTPPITATTPTPLIEPTTTPTPRPTATITPIRSPKTSNLVIIPNLVGLPEATAQEVINRSSLMTTYTNYQTIADVADKTFFRSISPGAVLSQSPAPGTEVPPGTRVYLAVRKQ